VRTPAGRARYTLPVTGSDSDGGDSVGSPLHFVTFEPSGARVGVSAGVTLREAGLLAGVHVEAPCGGLGTCGRCTVVTSGALEPPSSDELVLLSPERLASGVRLACRARVLGDVIVRQERAPARDALRIVEDSDIGGLAVEAPQRRGISGPGALLGAAVDIGTTTVVTALLDLRTGERSGVASAINPQHPFGHDVMSRISHAASHGVESLRAPIAKAVEDLVLGMLAASGHGPGDLREIALCGNTTMVHLLLGLDPAPLGVAPYEPAFLSRVDRPASEIGLPRLADARAYVLPGISAFVGSDITAGILATGLAARDTLAVLIDLGTNGEIVLRTKEGLFATSTAAGPALEGASIAYGMRAEPGAIERVTLDGDDLVVGTIGEVAPLGICGSGLLDLIAVLLETGVLDGTGRLRDDVPHPLASRVRDADGVRLFEVAPNVLLTQRDVRQVQLAKGAISSGIDLLLESAGVAADDVDELIIAGGFGYHVRAGALVRMGMIPGAWRSRTRFAGNTAEAGARLTLLDSEARRRADAVSRHIATVDLASLPGFQARFIAAMDFPSGV
jgi:uncharacterized 2Fe-2S/4Fe-4S cluster protein (DUF4445 family)